MKTSGSTKTWNPETKTETKTETETETEYGIKYQWQKIKQFHIA